MAAGWRRHLYFLPRLPEVAGVVLSLWILMLFFVLSSDDSTQTKKESLQQMPRLDGHHDDHLSSDVIHVCFTSDRNTIIGTMAAINSVHQNTRQKVKYHVVVEQDIVNDVKQWLSGSVLRGVDTEVIRFDVSLLHGKIKVRGGRTELAKPMNYARFLYPHLLPKVRGRIIHLDDDIIVKGDINQLASIKFESNKIAAFSEDCVSASKRFSLFENKYINFLNFKNDHIKELHMDPSACSFNTGMFVSDLGAWVARNVSDRLLYWTELNTRENIYGNQKGGGGSQPPMMIVFYKQYASLDPLWHVRHLGSSLGRRYSVEFIKQAKLLHWNGRQKPWGVMAQYQSIWDRYYVPDPSGKYQRVRRNRQRSLNDQDIVNSKS